MVNNVSCRATRMLLDSSRKSNVSNVQRKEALEGLPSSPSLEGGGGGISAYTCPAHSTSPCPGGYLGTCQTASRPPSIHNGAPPDMGVGHHVEKSVSGRSRVLEELLYRLYTAVQTLHQQRMAHACKDQSSTSKCCPTALSWADVCPEDLDSLVGARGPPR